MAENIFFTIYRCQVGSSFYDCRSGKLWAKKKKFWKFKLILFKHAEHHTVLSDYELINEWHTQYLCQPCRVQAGIVVLNRDPERVKFTACLLGVVFKKFPLCIGRWWKIEKILCCLMTVRQIGKYRSAAITKAIFTKKNTVLEKAT